MTDNPKKTRARFLTAGLRAQQVRILRVLHQNFAPMSRAQIMEQCSRSGKPTDVGDSLGPSDPGLLDFRTQKAGFPSLLALGLVKQVLIPRDGSGGEEGTPIYGYVITKEGLDRLNRANKELEGKGKTIG